MAEPPRLQLLTRQSCHLCDVAAETLARIAAEAGTAPETLDVDADPGEGLRRDDAQVAALAGQQL